MVKFDLRIILIVIGLYLVGTFLKPGPFRSQLEIDLVLMIVPGLPEVIEVLELLGSGIDTSSSIFYIGLVRMSAFAYFQSLIFLYLIEKFPILKKLNRQSK